MYAFNLFAVPIQFFTDIQGLYNEANYPNSSRPLELATYKRDINDFGTCALCIGRYLQSMPQTIAAAFQPIICRHQPIALFKGWILQQYDFGTINVITKSELKKCKHKIKDVYLQQSCFFLFAFCLFIITTKIH